MWPLTFISEADLYKHITATIEKYGQHSQIGDYDIGYFHKTIFQYIDNCSVSKDGWDLLCENDNGIHIPNVGTVRTIYVKFTDKRITMNSASARDSYIRMQNQLLNDKDCACFLVEAIAEKSQNIMWAPTVLGSRVGHKLIRRVSLDRFYAIVTGQDDAFYQLCMVLPSVIEKAVNSSGKALVPHDTAFDELKAMAETQGVASNDMAIAMAVYMLGFGSYIGFSN